MKIGHRILLGFFIVAVLVSVVGFISIATIQQSIKNSVGEDSLAFASKIILNIEDELHDTSHNLEELITRADVIHALRESNKAFASLPNVTEFMLQRDQEWISLPPNETNDLLTEILENDLSLSFQHFSNIHSQETGTPFFGEIFLTNKYGATIASTNRLTDYFQADEEWWQESVHQEFLIGDIEFDESSQILGTVVTYRITDENGTFLGVLKAVYNIDAEFQLLADIERTFQRQGKSIDIIVIDTQARLLYQNKPFTLFEPHPELLEYTGPSPEKFSDFFTIHNDENGVEKLFAHVHTLSIDDPNGLPLVLIIGRPTSELFLPIQELSTTLTMFSIIIIVFALLLGLSISHSISSRLKKFVGITAEISKGNRDRRIEITSTDELGELAQSFNYMTDQLNKSHEKINQHANELEKTIEFRTRELKEKVRELSKTKTAMLNIMEDMEETNTNLQKTQNELRQMDIKKDQFISIAAHELKTPLTAIHGFAQLLQNSSIMNNKEKREKYLDIVDKETKRLSELVNSILDLSRIDLNTVKLSYQPVDILTLMEDINKEMQIPTKAKGLQLVFSLPKTLSVIKTDKERLTQTLINLIGNAIKYTPKGTITVAVAEEGDVVHFSVKDTGIGISRKYQDKIFDRFYQVDSSYTRKVGGVGLGLSLSQEFITLMGGKLWVESEPGKGSTFHFILPFKKVPSSRA